MKDKIIVALDVQTKNDFNRISQELMGHAEFVKVGMELFYTFGPQVIEDLKKMNFKVFLDLKIHDIPNTAKKAAKTITKLGVDMINVHAAGGIEMMIAAKEGVNEALEENNELKKPIMIAVTQLTSTDQKMIQNDLLIDRPIHETVVHYAQMAMQAGLDGVVSSPLEVKLIKEKLGEGFLTVTPGIRPAGTSSNDQKRVTTPHEAIKRGTDYMVIGRAITNVQKPAVAFKEILHSIEKDIL